MVHLTGCKDSTKNWYWIFWKAREKIYLNTATISCHVFKVNFKIHTLFKQIKKKCCSWGGYTSIKYVV